MSRKLFSVNYQLLLPCIEILPEIESTERLIVICSHAIKWIFAPVCCCGTPGITEFVAPKEKGRKRTPQPRIEPRSQKKKKI